jgi:hypothetical protein
MMEIYMDDCFTIGYNEGIKEVIENLKNHDFGLKIEEDFKDLSCHIKINKDERIAWIQQSHLINNLTAKFGEETMAMRDHGTPGTPQFKIVRPNDEDKIPIVSQSRNRSGVGMPLYLINHSRRDFANVVGEIHRMFD